MRAGALWSMQPTRYPPSSEPIGVSERKLVSFCQLGTPTTMSWLTLAVVLAPLGSASPLKRVAASPPLT